MYVQQSQSQKSGDAVLKPILFPKGKKTVTVWSFPAKANVVVEGEERVRCDTPCSFVLNWLTPEKIPYLIIEKPGYRTLRRQIPLTGKITARLLEDDGSSLEVTEPEGGRREAGAGEWELSSSRRPLGSAGGESPSDSKSYSKRNLQGPSPVTSPRSTTKKLKGPIIEPVITPVTGPRGSTKSGGAGARLNGQAPTPSSRRRRSDFPSIGRSGQRQGRIVNRKPLMSTFLRV